MKLFNIFRRRSSAPVAKERLHILLKHERGSVGNRSELVTLLRKDVLAAVARHVAINPEHVHMKLQREADTVSMIVEIELKARSAPNSSNALYDSQFRPGGRLPGAQPPSPTAIRDRPGFVR